MSGLIGSAASDKYVDGKPRISSSPYTYDIAEGNIPDHSTFSKIGFHAAISTTELDMAPWMTSSYVYPTAALTMTIVSSSVEDKKTTGTGAWSVIVYYLTTGFEEKNVTVDMNGQTPVTLASDIYRVQNARIVTVGTALSAVGNITIASGGITYGYISATKTRMRQCLWTVPVSKTLYITQMSFSCAQQATSKYVRFTFRANYDNMSSSVLQRGLFMPYAEIALNNTSFTRELDPPIRLPSTVDLKVSAIADSTAVGTCELRGWTE